MIELIILLVVISKIAGFIKKQQQSAEVDPLASSNGVPTVEQLKDEIRRKIESRRQAELSSETQAETESLWPPGNEYAPQPVPHFEEAERDPFHTSYKPVTQTPVSFSSSEASATARAAKIEDIGDIGLDCSPVRPVGARAIPKVGLNPIMRGNRTNRRVRRSPASLRRRLRNARGFSEAFVLKELLDSPKALRKAETLP